MPRFDRMAGMLVKTITNLMGESAIWLSSDHGEVRGDVLFKNPTEASPIGDSENYEYRVSNATVEYYAETFTGLKETVDNEGTEYLIIRDSQYLVVSITSKFDGRIYVAQLEPHQTQE